MRDFYFATSPEEGRFLDITTHFATDAALEGHRDPHCFDLTHLYALIAATVGHEKGTTHGIPPTYGTEWGQSVWWDRRICGGSEPPAD